MKNQSNRRPIFMRQDVSYSVVVRLRLQPNAGDICRSLAPLFLPGRQFYKKLRKSGAGGPETSPFQPVKFGSSWPDVRPRCRSPPPPFSIRTKPNRNGGKADGSHHQNKRTSPVCGGQRRGLRRPVTGPTTRRKILPMRSGGIGTYGSLTST